MALTSIEKLFAFNAVVLVVFVCVYASLLPDAAEFDVPSGDKRDLSSAVYYAVATHTTVGYGDVLARSRRARMLTTVHMALVFCGMLYIGSAPK